MLERCTLKNGVGLSVRLPAFRRGPFMHLRGDWLLTGLQNGAVGLQLDRSCDYVCVF